MTQLLQNIIDINPYKVELYITDYQDEGLKLDFFAWKDECNLLESDTLATGEHQYLLSKMIEINDLLLKNNVNSSYDLHVERC